MNLPDYPGGVPTRGVVASAPSPKGAGASVPPSEERRVPPLYGPLQDVRVVDTGRVVAGPWAATFLADFGAEVVHVEGPPFGPSYVDPSRLLPPLLPVGAPSAGQVSESWVQYGRNKLSLGLDLTTAKGRELLLDLLERSQIWIDASRPGTFDKLGLSDATVLEANPALVIVHVSGFGQTGDPRYVRRASYDLIAQAMSGYLACQGEPDPKPPMQSGTAINDLVTGLGAATAALMALHHAERTGEGQVVDVAAYELFFLMMENMAVDYFSRGEVRQRHGAAHPRLYPYGIYPARDGWVALAAPTPLSWEKLRSLVGLPEEPSWRTMEGRLSDRDRIDLRLREFTRARSVHDLEELGLQNDVAFAPILGMQEIAENPQFRAREMLLGWEDPVLGPVRGAGVAPKLSRTPGRVWRGGPWLGQDNDAVLSGILGLSEPARKALRQAGVVGEYRPDPKRARDGGGALHEGSP
ncbi:MAG: CoA transferase [Euryarchaeota archaeon]|nr:CoA transferase [Euryarchaeota archaeon]